MPYPGVNRALCVLQSAEIERLLTWHNPQNRAELHMAGEEHMAAWRAQLVTDKQWKDHVRLAWEISPTLAVMLPERFKGAAPHSWTVCRRI